MLHQYNIWCAKLIDGEPSVCKRSEAFFLSLHFGRNNLAESVTFLVATDIGFVFSINITYYKYNIYKAKHQGKYSKARNHIDSSSVNAASPAAGEGVFAWVFLLSKEIKWQLGLSNIWNNEPPSGN